MMQLQDLGEEVEKVFILERKTKQNYLQSHLHLSTTSHPTHTYSHIFCLGKKP